MKLFFVDRMSWCFDGGSFVIYEHGQFINEQTCWHLRAPLVLLLLSSSLLLSLSLSLLLLLSLLLVVVAVVVVVVFILLV